MRGLSYPKRELITLLNLQLATFQPAAGDLEKEVFGVVTDAKRREYWRRHDRIHSFTVSSSMYQH
jgi:hypothetical protein